MIELEKQRLRKTFKEQRSALTPDVVENKSKEICQNFISNLLPKIYYNLNHQSLEEEQKIFSVYLSSQNEPSCSDIVQPFKKNLIPFSYPKIIQKNQPLEFVLASKNQKFSANKFYPKILEPITGEKILPDFLILPLLAFDTYLS